MLDELRFALQMSFEFIYKHCDYVCFRQASTSIDPTG